MPTNILDDLQKIKQLDSQNMLGSLQCLSKQVEQIWTEARQLKIPTDYGQISNILILGMGGSALGAGVFKNLFKAELKVPVEIVSDYEIPGFVDDKTLVIAASYSGSTEEPINAVKQAKKKGAKIMGICAGGLLADWCKTNRLPVLVFSTRHNPSNQPRMGQGYLIIGQLLLLDKIDLLKLSIKQIKEIIKVLADYESIFGVLTPASKNQVKNLAQKIIGKTVWYVASEHLSGNAHVAANQLNENAKRFGGYYLLPELNHHLLEGMLYPKSNPKSLFFVLLESKLYHERNQKRYQITKQVLDKNGIQYFNYTCQSKSRLAQVCEVLVFASYVSYYSALLENINPSPIPYVDFFKTQMK